MIVVRQRAKGNEISWAYSNPVSGKFALGEILELRCDPEPSRILVNLESLEVRLAAFDSGAFRAAQIAFG